MVHDRLRNLKALVHHNDGPARFARAGDIEL
jgi:hypothetical protein